MIRRLLTRRRQAVAEWEAHVEDALNLFDPQHEAPEFGPVGFDLADALWLHIVGIEA